MNNKNCREFMLNNREIILHKLFPDYKYFKKYVYNSGGILLNYFKGKDKIEWCRENIPELVKEYEEKAKEINDRNLFMEYMITLYLKSKKRITIKNGLFNRRIVKILKVKKTYVETLRFDLPESHSENEAIKLSRRSDRTYIEVGKDIYGDNALFWKPPAKGILLKTWKKEVYKFLPELGKDKESTFYGLFTNSLFDKNLLKCIMGYL